MAKSICSQYGAISSATALVNTILPIVGGYGLDYYGVEWYVFFSIREMGTIEHR